MSMQRPDDVYTSNLLLSAMAANDLALLKPWLRRVDIMPEQVLGGANELIERVYFLEDGIASIVSIRPDSGKTEVGIFGREGMSGTSLVMGVDCSPHETFMQVDGTTALRIDAERVIDAMDQSRSLTKLLLAYVHVLMTQTAACAVGNAHHHLEARLARWLLMCHDRVDGDEILLTHDFMAMMIASQRSGVTITLHVLEGMGAIRSKRGRVIIVDRDKLEDLAGDAYGEPEGEYRRLIGPFGRKGVVIPFDAQERSEREDD
ncbi:Crp/Fnr family transcriptional regulator [Sphingomonas montana]|uniref:Crp/Fnr family transcriptional regulator n=1 Tax=Sphingomonas montana TaxID=1843236 RepID=UPI0009F8D264|nr:Crp/Fnr family transcriptional regulator [Sphingomonas montana]